jgi:hypothetical protein
MDVQDRKAAQKFSNTTPKQVGPHITFESRRHDAVSAMRPAVARPIRPTQPALVVAAKSSNTRGESSWHIGRDGEEIQAGRNSPKGRVFEI